MTAQDDEIIDVTVVIPAYRREDFVAEAVASALAQRPRPSQVIVVDDCSPDESGDRAKAAGATVIRHSVNKGVGEARNTGLTAASTEWVALLDGDDVWLPGHLKRLWEARNGHVLVGANGRGTQDQRWYGSPGPRSRVLRHPQDAFQPEASLFTSGVMVHRRSALAINGFGHRKRGQDLEFFIRLLEQGTGIAIPVESVVYRQHDDQTTVGRADMQSAFVEIIDSFRTRPWFKPAMRTRAQGTIDWDAARRATSRLTFARAVAVIVVNPHKLWGLVTTLDRRRRLRASAQASRAASLTS